MPTMMPTKYEKWWLAREHTSMAWLSCEACNTERLPPHRGINNRDIQIDALSGPTAILVANRSSRCSIPEFCSSRFGIIDDP